eukprot:9857416-Karenia_brevis.AAC.1
MANIYFARHIEDLGARANVLKVSSRKSGSIEDRFKDHIEQRVNDNFPDPVYGGSGGAVPL